SVTVSIAADTSGMARSIPRARRVEVSTALGSTSDSAGWSRTSSKVSASGRDSAVIGVGTVSSRLAWISHRNRGPHPARRRGGGTAGRHAAAAPTGGTHTPPHTLAGRHATAPAGRTPRRGRTAWPRRRGGRIRTTVGDVHDEPLDPFHGDPSDPASELDRLAGDEPVDPLSETERQDVLEDLTDLEIYQALLAP